MESHAKLFGHPVHQMLIVFPLGLLATAVVFDIIRIITGSLRWADISYWMIAAGLLTGMIAAVFGVIDWRHIPKGTRARRVGTLHGLGNLLVVLLFAASWMLRSGSPMDPPLFAYVLSFAGALLTFVTGWLGGELVDRLGIGVHEGANVNAPSSLSGQPAAPTTQPYDRRAVTGP